MFWLTLLTFYFAISLLIHSFVCHFIKHGTVFAKFFIVGTFVGICFLIQVYEVYGFGLLLVSAALTYGFLCELYIFTFSFIASSISVSILLRLMKGETAIKDLAVDYRASTMVSNRLRRMLDIGLLNEVNNTLQLTTKGQNIINRFNKLQFFFRLNQAAR